jgi:glycosyltransferase involved in cell wall biosynthesis
MDDDLRNGRDLAHAPGLTDGGPLFSVIVPAYDCPQPLRRCLEGLAALRFPPDRFEVIIADDGSPTPMEPLTLPFRDRLRLRVIRHANRGPAAARNRGAEHARGTYLAFIDSDCVPAPDWLTALERRFVRTPDHLICGGIVNALPANPFSAATQLIVTFVHGYHARQPTGERFFNSTNIAIPAKQFRDLGGFEESLRTAEDYDLCHRWQYAGHEMTHAPEVLVHHRHVLTLASFCRQHFQYGRGLFHCRLRIARRTGKPFRGERAGFYLRLLRFPLTQRQGFRGWLHALLIVLSQVVSAGGVLREALPEIWQRIIAPGGQLWRRTGVS